MFTKELSMSIQDVLQRLKPTSAGRFRHTAFLIMFIGVVVGPLVLFVIGGRNPAALGQHGLAWPFLAIALLLFISVGGGFLRFRRESRATKDLSINRERR
jgi:hypothetical protein